MVGADRLGNCETLQKLLREQQNAQRWVTAICASPVKVLEKNGLIDGRNATAHPAVSGELTNSRWVGGGTYNA